MKEQFKENIFSILEDKNVESIPLKNIEILNYIFNDKELLNQMYKHFEDNFNLEFKDDDLCMKTEDFVYRLNMLVNNCIIPKCDFHEKEDIKNKVQELVDNNIDLYFGVSYDKSDRIILDEFCELCNEMEINMKDFKDFKRFVRSHNLVNRIYDMVCYFGMIKDDQEIEKEVKMFFHKRLEDIVYVEELAKYFEEKLRKHRKEPDIRCNLLDLINDLNYLKQYLI